MWLHKMIPVILLMLLSIETSAEMRIVKDWRFPILRVNPRNPPSIANSCEPRFFLIRHRRDDQGRPFSITIEPIDHEDIDLLPIVELAFLRWRFKVPRKPEWKREFLDIEHQNLFFTMPSKSCDTETFDIRDYFDKHEQLLPQAGSSSRLKPFSLSVDAKIKR